MVTSIPTAAGSAVPLAGSSDGTGDALTPFVLPPITYRLWFTNAQFDLLGGQYQDLYAKQSVIPTIGAVKPPHTKNLLTGSIQSLALPACAAYVLLVRDGEEWLHFKTYVNLSLYHSLPRLPETPWDNRLFLQQGDLVHATGGFTYLSLEECPNDSFNLTENIPILAKGDVTMALSDLANP